MEWDIRSIPLAQYPYTIPLVNKLVDMGLPRDSRWVAVFLTDPPAHPLPPLILTLEMSTPGYPNGGVRQGAAQAAFCNVTRL